MGEKDYFYYFTYTYYMPSLDRYWGSSLLPHR